MFFKHVMFFPQIKWQKNKCFFYFYFFTKNFLSGKTTFIIQLYHRYLLFYHVGKGVENFSTGNELVH